MENKLNFRQRLLISLQNLVIKSVRSRKAFYHFLTVLLCIAMICRIQDVKYSIAVLLVLVLENLAYAGILVFEKVKIDISKKV